MAQLDLNELSQSERYRLSLEPQEDPAERAHRHRQEWLATMVRQGLHVLLVLFAIGMVGLMAWYCLGILTGSITVSGASAAVTAEAQKWSMVILSAIVSGPGGIPHRESDQVMSIRKQERCMATVAWCLGGQIVLILATVPLAVLLTSVGIVHCDEPDPDK